MVEAFALQDERYVFVIGGGGKTSLIAALARELGGDRRVICTTSTKIRCPDEAGSEQVIVSDLLPEVISRLERRRRDAPPATVARSILPGKRKLCGFSADELDRLLDADVADCILVEADGSAGRSLKAHADHEPVVSPRADLVVTVIGIDCVGKLLTDEHVHRAQRFCELLGRNTDPITVDDVVAIFFHPRGYLREVDPRSRVAVFFSKAKTDADRVVGRRLAEGLLAADREGRISTIVVGDLRGQVQVRTVNRATRS